MRSIPFLIGWIFLCLLTAFNLPQKGPRLPKEFVWVPMAADNQPGELTGINGFFMSQFEVTNRQYREFLAATMPGLSDSAWQQIMIDTLGWRQALTYCEPLVEYYHRHPAFNDYPVVNISYEGAMAYCRWLQAKLAADNAGYTVEVTLPGKTQWIWAARGGRSNSRYPWDGNDLRNKKGEYLCNFSRVDESLVVRNPQTGKPELTEWVPDSHHYGRLYTGPVKSYYPNGFKLYNISGNVAEMIAEKGICMGGSWYSYGGEVTTTSEAKYNGPEPMIGFRPIIICTSKSGR